MLLNWRFSLIIVSSKSQYHCFSGMFKTVTKIAIRWIALSSFRITSPRIIAQTDNDYKAYNFYHITKIGSENSIFKSSSQKCREKDLRLRTAVNETDFHVLAWKIFNFTWWRIYAKHDIYCESNSFISIYTSFWEKQNWKKFFLIWGGWGTDVEMFWKKCMIFPGMIQTIK